MALLNLALANAILSSTALNAFTQFSLYSGPVPASADAALSGNTLLVVHSFNGFGIAQNKIRTANPIEIVSAVASGVVSFGRLTGGGFTIQITPGAEFVITAVNNSLIQGAPSQITSLVMGA